jgi:hypothetical protein
MWVPWKAGQPGQQSRGTRGTMTGDQAAAKARQRKRQDAFKLLKKGKITPAQYQAKLKKIGQ